MERAAQGVGNRARGAGTRGTGKKWRLQMGMGPPRKPVPRPADSQGFLSPLPPAAPFHAVTSPHLPAPPSPHAGAHIWS